MTAVLLIAAAAVAVVLLYYWLTDRHPLEAVFDATAGLFGTGQPGGGRWVRQSAVALFAATVTVMHLAGEGASLVTLVMAVLLLALAGLVLFNLVMVVALRRLLRPRDTASGRRP